MLVNLTKQNEGQINVIVQKYLNVKRRSNTVI